MNRLIEKGYNVTGLDLSENMLERARKLMPKEVLLKEDMTKFDLGKKFDMVLCNYNSICHLLKFEDWNNFMKCANNHLKD
jgi:2-polyprenyl-3-methyl-5-hydroxy-6-metoxy-1,4-benzoquinol methylase